MLDLSRPVVHDAILDSSLTGDVFKIAVRVRLAVDDDLVAVNGRILAKAELPTIIAGLLALLAVHGGAIIVGRIEPVVHVSDITVVRCGLGRIVV